MFIVENETFYVTWGDKGSFDVTFEDYTFSQGDILTLKVYEEDAMDEDPVLQKSIIIDAEADIATFNLASADTRLGDPTNERVTYWYEITLTHSGHVDEEQTPFCYDEKGPKLFYIYPGGVNGYGSI